MCPHRRGHAVAARRRIAVQDDDDFMWRCQFEDICEHWAFPLCECALRRQNAPANDHGDENQPSDGEGDGES